MDDKVEMVVDSVRVSLMSALRVVILRQTDEERYLPIWVGPFEAESITVALQEVEVSRPMTHDLLKNVFALFNGKVLQVEIISIKGDVFYGNIVAETGGKTVSIDSRPSDAIALALRTHSPILVSRQVMEEAGIVPEKDLQGGAEPEALESLETPLPLDESGPGDEQRLDVFEDFLKKLGPDQDEDKPTS